MACEQEVVLGLNSQGVSHECRRVYGQSTGEGTGDAAIFSSAEVMRVGGRNAGRLGGGWDAEYADGDAILRVAMDRTYMLGSFCVSKTAARGIPKFETGPQKSICESQVSIGSTSQQQRRLCGFKKTLEKTADAEDERRAASTMNIGQETGGICCNFDVRVEQI